MIRSTRGVAASVLFALLAAAWPAAAQDDPLAELLFPPELVMQHQQAIALSADQRSRLVAEVTGAQADFLPRQMELAEHGEVLRRLLAEPRIDEARALETAVAMMDLETRIKRRHLELAIRIKNLLSPEQQARLAELRRPRP